MALKGTLKDFGIADILQLIGQQQKTGVLTVTAKSESVSVSFKDGAIVRAESVSRNQKSLIGTMLVRAGLIEAAQLESALETQKRTLQRLGDLLVGSGAIDAEKFRQMVHLKTSETLYRLFTWHGGNYHFEQQEVEVDAVVIPMRAESVLMEGFRRVDEWPVIRKRIASLQMTFERVRALPPPHGGRDGLDAALDEAFDGKSRGSTGEFESIGEAERLCASLAEPGRTVQRIAELSCLGEFETAKALANLINLGYLNGLPAAQKGGDEFEGDSRLTAVLSAVSRVALTMALLAGLAFVGRRVDVAARFDVRATTFTDPALQRFVSRQQRARIAAALEVHRIEHGHLPETLGELREAGLLSADDLRYPWRDEYYYRRGEAEAYVLLPPLR